MKRNRSGQFVKKSRRRKASKKRRVYASRKPRAHRKKRRRSINGLSMNKASGSLTSIAMEGLGAGVGSIGAKMGARLAQSKLGVSPLISGAIVFAAGVLVAKKVHRGAGLGMCGVGAELVADKFLPEGLTGIGDLDQRDVDMIERAAMRGVEDAMNGDDPLNGDDDVNGDPLNGDDDVNGPLNGDDDVNGDDD